MLLSIPESVFASLRFPCSLRLCIPLSSLFPFASRFDPAGSLLPSDFLEHCWELWEASWREKGPLSALHGEDP